MSGERDVGAAIRGCALECDVEGRILHVSSAASGVFDLAETAIVGRRLCDLLVSGRASVSEGIAGIGPVVLMVTLPGEPVRPARLLMDWVASAGVWDGRLELQGDEGAPCVAVNALDEALLLLDLDGCIRECNPRARDLFGVSEGKCVRSDDGEVAALIRRALAAETTVCGSLPHGPQIEIRAHRVTGGYQVMAKDVTAVRRARARAADSDRTYRELFENAVEGFYLAAPDGRLRDANPALARILGYASAEALLAADAPDVLGEAGIREDVRRILGDRETVPNLEHTVTGADGAVREVVESIKAIRSVDGRLAGYQGTVQDISARKRSERELRESEATLKNVVEMAGLGVSFTTPEGILIDASDPYCRLLGISLSSVPRGEGLSSRKSRYIHPEDQATLAGLWETATADLRAAGADIRFVRQNDGAVRQGRFAYQPVVNEAGRLERVIGLMQDVTDVRLTEERLAARDRELGLIIANIPGAIVKCALSHDGRLSYPVVRGGLGELWKGELADFGGGVDLDALLTPERGARLEELLRASAQDMSEIDEVVSYMQHNCEPGWLRLLACPQLGPEGGVQWIGVLVDITAQKKFEERLVENERMLRHAQRLESIGRFAGGVAHEFNNLLQPIQMMTEVVRRRLPGEGAEHRALGDVIGACADARDLVRQILDFARREEDERPSEVHDLAEIVNVRLGLIQAAVPCGIEMRLGLDEGVCAQVDPAQMQQVLLNICQNAAHAMEGQGMLVIKVREERVLGAVTTTDRDLPAGRYAVLSIMDTGPGIRAEDVSKIFDPFYTTKGPRGSGLGLSGVHGIVTRAGGGIKVTTAPGRGTTFEIYLPAATAAAQSGAGEREYVA